MTTILQVDDLHLAYNGNAVLKGVSFSLAKGEVVSLLGPSGSGKTTLLRAVAGLEEASGGRISIGGKPVFDHAAAIEVTPEKRDLGLVFQSYALWPHKTVFDNVAYGLKLRKVAAAETAERVHQALGNLGLGHLAERYPHELSGGQQQRVAMARALVYNPPLILLDEPLSNLDAKLREEARAWLRELIVTLGLSALCVTHDQAEAMAMSDRVLLLNQGRIEQEGSPQQMYRQPKSLFVADFMGSNNRLPGQVVDVSDGLARLEGEGWSLCGTAQGEGEFLQRGDAAAAMIRLEKVKVVAQPGDNTLCGRLTTSMFLGDRWEHLFHVGGLSLRAFSHEHHEPGDYWLQLAPRDLWVFAAAKQ